MVGIRSRLWKLTVDVKISSPNHETTHKNWHSEIEKGYKGTPTFVSKGETERTWINPMKVIILNR